MIFVGLFIFTILIILFLYYAINYRYSVERVKNKIIEKYSNQYPGHVKLPNYINVVYVKILPNSVTATVELRDIDSMNIISAKNINYKITNYNTANDCSTTDFSCIVL